jgi:ABC-2 type transport system ATP-binding protein
MKRLLVDAVADGPCAVKTQNLRKRFGQAVALDAIDVRIPTGAVYALVGPNGAGKTTLIRILMHLIRADAGSAHVIDLDVRQAGPEVRAQIGYVPETQELGTAWLSIGRLLERNAVFYPTWDRAYADRLLSAFEIHPGQNCGALSKGQRRRVQLVLALAHRPPMLLLDEPADGLDHIGRDRALSALTEHLADSPTTVLISTHRIWEFEGLIDHIGVLHQGALVAQTTRDRMLQMLRRYAADVPEGWVEPPDFRDVVLRRTALGRRIDWTLMGEEREIVERLTNMGAVVREVATLSLDDAAVALLSSREAR